MFGGDRLLHVQSATEPQNVDVQINTHNGQLAFGRMTAKAEIPPTNGNQINVLPGSG
jgi:hypothetical protein